MPMIRESLKKLSGRTLNSSLSPDQSIAHGAAYYAGMLLSNDQYARTVFNSTASSRLAKVQQKSVNARALGILIRDETGERVPHYLIPANTPLPTSKTHVFGTVVDNQTRVHVRIVESGAGADRRPTVLGDCQITNLPADLPEGTEIEVTISYDHQARVHVSAREPVSGVRAEAELIRQENLNAQLQEKPEISATPAALPADKDFVSDNTPAAEIQKVTAPASTPPVKAKKIALAAVNKPALVVNHELEALAELSNLFADGELVMEEQPVLLCNDCGSPLLASGQCSSCSKAPLRPQPNGKRKAAAQNTAAPGKRVKGKPASSSSPPENVSSTGRRNPSAAGKPPADPNEAEFWDLVDDD